VSSSHTQQLLAQVPAARRPPWLADPEVDLALSEALAEGLALAPIAITEAQILTALARVLDNESPLSAYRLADLAVAQLAAAGHTKALRHLKGPLFTALRPALRHLGINETTSDEVLADLLAYLLVREGDVPPRMLNYRGRGPLRRWLRTIAIRRAYRAGKTSAIRGDDAPLATLPTDDDPELVVFKRRYANAFRNAFIAALRELSPRQRNLLRFHHLEQLTVDDLGSLYQVHRATAARWITRARSDLANGTRQHLQAAIGGATKAEAESLIRLVRSQLDLSLHRFLDDDDDNDDELTP